MKVILPAKRVGETRNFLFDFTSLLTQSNEDINSASFTVAVYSGVDSSPTNILSGTPSVSGAVVTQSFTGGVVGTIYQVVCTAVTNYQQHLQLQAFLAIQLDAT